MAKSSILKELANNKITIEVALSRLLIIASDINNNELTAWVEKELNGYSAEDTIPSYRRFNASYLRYSGINGSFQVKNQPLPLGYLKPKTRENINPVFVFDSISTVQKYACSKDDQEIGRDLSFLASEVYDNTGIQCLKITQMMSVTYYQEIISQVRGRLLKIFIELDKAYGNLDDLDIDITQKDVDYVQKINQEIVNLAIDNSIHIGDNNKLDKSNIGGK